MNLIERKRTNWWKSRIGARRRPGRRIRGAALNSVLEAHRIYLVRADKLADRTVPLPIVETGKQADFRSADLSGISFRGWDLRNADFTAAILRGVDLTGANIKNARLTGADLRGTIGLTAEMIDGAICLKTILPDDVYDATVARYGPEGSGFIYLKISESPANLQRPLPGHGKNSAIRNITFG